MHEITTVAEVKRLFGDFLDDAIKVSVPGMEIGTQHKYGFNILIDFKPGESPLRPAAASLMRSRGQTTTPRRFAPTSPASRSPAFSPNPSRSCRRRA